MKLSMSWLLLAQVAGVRQCAAVSYGALQPVCAAQLIHAAAKCLVRCSLVARWRSAGWPTAYVLCCPVATPPCVLPTSTLRTLGTCSLLLQQQGQQLLRLVLARLSWLGPATVVEAARHTGCCVSTVCCCSMMRDRRLWWRPTGELGSTEDCSGLALEVTSSVLFDHVQAVVTTLHLECRAARDEFSHARICGVLTLAHP